MKKIKRLSIMHILVHGFAFFYTGIGFGLLFFLTSPDKVRILHNIRAVRSVVTSEDYLAVRSMIDASAVIMLVTMIAAFIASIIIANRRRLNWLNSLLALFVTGGLGYLMVTYRDTYKSIIWLVSNILHLKNIPSFVVTGLIWSSLGLFALFNPKTYKKYYPEQQSEVNEFEFEKSDAA